ncbi:MAG: hypothetical protein NVSMB18_14450 [Acetobacteraceae bacterium]
MQLTRLAPAGAPADRTRTLTVATSALLHLGVFALVLGIAARRPPPEPTGPSYDLVFEGPNATLPPPGQDLPAQPAQLPVPADTPPGPPAPAPSSAPTPDGVPSPRPEAALTGAAPTATEAAPAPAEASQPRPATIPTPRGPALALPSPPDEAPHPSAAPPAASIPEPPAVALAPPPPAEVPPVGVPAPEPPAVRLEQPPSTPRPAEAESIVPQPPPPPARAPARPAPRPTPRAPPGSLANPMDLSFAPAAPRPAPAARGSVASRAIDLALGIPRVGPDRSDPNFRFTAKNASADWDRALQAYWLRHRYYPSKAVENFEEGTVVLEMTVNRTGKVESVTVSSRSGSAWLDLAAVGTFRGAQLPPLPREELQERITFPISVTYSLIRG